MRIEDVTSVLAVGNEEKHFRITERSSGFWSEQVLINWVKSDSGVALVAVENQKIEGFALATVQSVTRKAELENLWVSSRYQGRGLSIILLQEVIRKLEESRMVDVIIALTEVEHHTIQNMLKKRVGFEKGKAFVWMKLKI